MFNQIYNTQIALDAINGETKMNQSKKYKFLVNLGYDMDELVLMSVRRLNALYKKELGLEYRVLTKQEYQYEMAN